MATKKNETFNDRQTRETTEADNTNPSRETTTRTTARDTARRRTATEDNVRPFTDENDLVNDNPRPVNVITDEDGSELDEQARINREVEQNQRESTASTKPGPKYTPNR